MFPYTYKSIDLSTIHPKLSGTLILHGDGTWLWWAWDHSGYRMISGGNRRPRKVVRPFNLHPRSPNKHFA